MADFKMVIPPTYPVLPIAYSDSISYYEQLMELYRKMQELIDYVNNFDTSVLTEANAYTDGKFSALRQEVYAKYDPMFVQLRADLEAQIEEVDSKYLGITNDMKIEYLQKIQEIYVVIQDLNADIGALYGYFARYQILINNQMNAMYDNLIDYIDEHISEMTQLYVFNPVDQKFVPIQKALNDIYDYSRGCSITAQEYDNMMLTATEYDNMRITARDFIVRARFIFVDKLYLYMLSPFTGAKVLIKEVVQQLANQRKDCLTAAEYDAKLLTATAFDALGITAYDYDWNSKTLIV